MLKIEIYRTETGKEPFVEWKDGLSVDIQARIDARITRIEISGNLGDNEPVGEGVFELRFHFGPGYRVYFGKIKKNRLLLLFGGSKKSQDKDIKKAKKFWQDHLSCH